MGVWARHNVPGCTRWLQQATAILKHIIVLVNETKPMRDTHTPNATEACVFVLVKPSDCLARTIPPLFPYGFPEKSVDDIFRFRMPKNLPNRAKCSTCIFDTMVEPGNLTQ